MVKSIAHILAIILNFGIIAFILGFALRQRLEIDTINSFVFIAVALVTPLLNISVFLGKPAFIKPMIAMVINTLVLAIFSFIILLVMIWPMGSKPHGVELVYIFSLYSALLFTELSHILKLQKR